jgi:hypothetical protein
VFFKENHFLQFNRCKKSQKKHLTFLKNDVY